MRLREVSEIFAVEVSALKSNKLLLDPFSVHEEAFFVDELDFLRCVQVLQIRFLHANPGKYSEDVLTGIALTAWMIILKNYIDIEDYTCNLFCEDYCLSEVINPLRLARMERIFLKEIDYRVYQCRNDLKLIQSIKVWPWMSEHDHIFCIIKDEASTGLEKVLQYLSDDVEKKRLRFRLERQALELAEQIQSHNQQTINGLRFGVLLLEAYSVIATNYKFLYQLLDMKRFITLKRIYRIVREVNILKDRRKNLGFMAPKKIQKIYP